MAIVQISRIQHRRGLSSDLPKPSLAEGELGFTVDTGQLFIGAPSFPPIVGRQTFPYQNLQILTEFSVRDMLNNLNYSYRYQDPSNPAFPGLQSYRADIGKVVERLLQERLDEFVSVKSYGAKGDALTNDRQAIENACIDLFGSSTSKRTDRVLYFPAGTYIIKGDPLPLFANTCWVGDGKGKTNIILDDTDVKSVIETAKMDNGTKKTILDIVATQSEPDLVENIFVSGISFCRINTGDVVRLYRCTDVTFNNCEFRTINEEYLEDLGQGDFKVNLKKNYDWSGGLQVGLWATFPTTTTYNSNTHGVSVVIDRLSQLIPQILPSDNFNFLNCSFDSNTYAFYAVDAITNINVIGCRFEDFYKAITLGEVIYYSPTQLNNVGNMGVSLPFDPSTQTHLSWDPKSIIEELRFWGPSGFKVSHSSFNFIKDTAFSVFSNRPGNGSFFNHYWYVGRNIDSSFDLSSIIPAPLVPSIYFYKKTEQNDRYLALNNYTVGDVFEVYDTTSNLISSPSISNLIINSQYASQVPAGLDLGIQRYWPMSPKKVELTDNDTTSILIEVPTSNHDAIIFDYSINHGERRRMGQIKIIKNSTTEDWSEEFVEVGTPLNVSITVSSTVTQIFVHIQNDDSFISDLLWSAKSWNTGFSSYD